MPVKMPKRAALLKERDIENTCSAFLELDGWRCIKTDLPHLRGLGVQEKGMADRLYLRYEQNPRGKQRGDIWCPEDCEAMWIEWKRPKGKVSAKQVEWHAAERARGAFTLIAGVAFPATIEGFRKWYCKRSGLARKVLA
jgi:hypothetical protein